MFKSLTIFLAISLTALASAANAQDFEQALLAKLRQEGYAQISTYRTFLGRIRFLATGAKGQREIVLNPRTGEVLRDVWLVANDFSQSSGGDGKSGSGASGGSGTGSSGGGSGSSGGGAKSDDRNDDRDDEKDDENDDEKDDKKDDKKDDDEKEDDEKEDDDKDDDKKDDKKSDNKGKSKNSGKDDD